MKLTWVNVEKEDEPRWGDRCSEQLNSAGEPLYRIHALHRTTLGKWRLTKDTGSTVTRVIEDSPLSFVKSVAQDDYDNTEEADNG